MARNIEIKARVENVGVLAPMIADVATEGPLEIAQDDTFFNCESGRLKLRAFSNDSGELIFYQRVNQAGPKESFYYDLPLHHPRHFVNRYRWPTDKSAASASTALSSWLDVPAFTWTASKALAIFSSSKSCWWTTSLPKRAFVRRVNSWISSEFSPNSSSKARTST